MSDTERFPHPPKPALASRVDELREAIQQVPVNSLADHTGAHYHTLEQGHGEFFFSLFDSPVLMTYPELVGMDSRRDHELPLPVQGVLAYYFHTSDGTPLTGQWVSFAELADGRMYNQAFQGYTGNELVKAFQLDVEAFELACQKQGGTAASIGGVAYIFYALPRVPLLVNYWCGDEDFPSSCKILFDSAVNHYLPTDVCAILGSMLARKLIKNRS